MSYPEIKIAVPDDIEQRIAQALIESTLNNAISEVIKEVCGSVADPKAYDNPVKAAVFRMSGEIIQTMLADDPQVVQAMRDAVIECIKSPEFAEQVATRVFKERDW